MRIDGRHIVIVVAHPDDETIGCGALLAHLETPTLVVVTDGAPRDMADARRCGFADCEAYAAERARELDAALDAAGCAAEVIRLGIPDQQAAAQLAFLSCRLAEILRRRAACLVLTHAYEGGHPDHDATAFASHMAARNSGITPAVVEMPYYRLGPDGMAAQSFAAPGDDTVAVRLPPDDRSRKQRMVAAHATQQAMLAAFDISAEHYRPAPHYDFTRLPNDGRLLYEQQNWGLTGDAWLRTSRAALCELGGTEMAPCR